MKYVAVLDYNQAGIYIYRVEEEEIKTKYNNDWQEFVIEQGHSESNSYYMVMDELKFKAQ